MSKRKTTEQFIEDALKIHGNKYDYSSVDYKNSTTKIEIICKIHGSWFQTPSHHLTRKQGCKKCGDIARGKSRAKSTKEFIHKANLIHNNKYQYLNTKYINWHKKVTITCTKHGDFKQHAGSHINGSGCPKCGRVSSVKKQSKTTEQFIKDAQQIHGNKYDYKKTKYIKARKELVITCKIHGDFEQVPYVHLASKGCPKCGDEHNRQLFVSSKKEFVKKAKIIHEERYDYSMVTYRNARNKVAIKCKTHGEFEQTPDAHLAGVGCPKCKNKSEGRIAEYLFKNHILIRQLRIMNKFYDFYLPDFNLIIERDGEQHYGIKSFAHFYNLDSGTYNKNQQKNDKYKTKIAKEKGFNIARIPYWLSKKEEEIEIENILAGKPTYPDVPDLKQEKTKPKPIKNF